MSKAPLLHLNGRLGLNGKAPIAVDGFASITKSHGAYMVRAAITTSDAQKILKLDEMKKRIPIEREAENRAKADIPEYTKGNDKFVPRAPGTKMDPIMTEQGAHLTYAGKAYVIAHAEAMPKMANLDAAEHERKQIDAGQRLHSRPRIHGDLVDPHVPKAPTPREGETEASWGRRMASYQRRMDKRIDERQSKPVSQKRMRQIITGQSEGSLMTSAITKIQEELGDTMTTPEPEETPVTLDRLLMANHFWFEAPNGQVVWFSQRMKEATRALLQGAPRVAIERDYQLLERELRRMQDFEVDQYEHISAQTNQPPFSMLVRVGEWVAMEKRRVKELVDDFHREQELAPPRAPAPRTPRTVRRDMEEYLEDLEFDLLFSRRR